jgi:Domain of unknown function (DUF5615)
VALLYADEDFDYPIVVELRKLGYDVTRVQETGQRGALDPDVLAYAISQGRAVMTHNRRHYIRLHRQIRPHRGIIVCTRDRDYPALAARIHQAITNCPNLDNQLLRVTRPHVP